MPERPTIIKELQQEVKETLSLRMSKIKKNLKADFKIKSKHLPLDEQKEIVNEMRETYFEPYRQSGILPSPIKLTSTSFQEYLSSYSDEELASRLEDPARRRDLINQTVHYFHFAEMYEFFNKLKADLDGATDQGKPDTKNQLLSKKTIQRTKDDNLTSLTARQTGLLLKELQEYRVFLGEGYLTKEDMYRVAQVTTGYGRDLVKKGYNKKETADTDRIAVANALKSIAEKLLKGTF